MWQFFENEQFLTSYSFAYLPSLTCQSAEAIQSESERYVCAMRSCQISLSGMKLRHCDVFLVMILFCLVVQAITGMCVALWKHTTWIFVPPSFKHSALASLSTMMIMINSPQLCFCLLSDLCWKIWSALLKIIKNQLYKNSIPFLKQASHTDKASFKIIATWLMSVRGTYWLAPT